MKLYEPEIIKTIKENNYNISDSAKSLGVTNVGLHKALRKYKIRVKKYLYKEGLQL